MTRVATAQPSPASQPAAPAGKLTRPPKLRAFVEAPFPESEKAKAQGAAVVLQVTIGAGGAVEEAKVTQSAGEAFDTAALAAVRAFRFDPAEIDGVPARIRILYRYEFVFRPELPKTASFHGTVRARGAPPRPLAGVAVTVEGAGSAVSDASGHFAIEDVPPGHHQVTLSGPRLPPTRVEEEFAAGRTLETRYDVTLAAPAAAPDEADDIEIVIRAPPVRRQAVSTEISADQARKLPGTQGDVLRVVENMPGVARAAAGSGALVVWGSAPADTRVYVDGVPVPRLYHDGGLRSILPTEFVSNVELAPGGYGAEYGRGLGGLVKVGTRALDDKGVHGAVSLDLYDAAASVRAALGDRVHIEAGLRRSHLDSALDLVDSRAGEYFPIPHYWDGQARLSIKLGPRESVELTGLYSLDSTTLGKASLDPLLATSQTRDGSFYRVSARYRNQLDDGSLVTITPFAGGDHDALTMNVGGTVADVVNDTVLFGVRGSWRGRIGKHLSIEAGLDADVRKSDLHRDGALALPPREGDIRVFGQPPPGTLARDDWQVFLIGVAPYAEADLALAAGKLHIEPGLRLDPNVRSVSRTLPAVGETPRIGLFADNFSFEPRLTVRYSPIEKLSLKAAAGLYHQQPAPEDLSAVFGSPTLPVAQAAQYLAGALVHVTRTLAIEATGFYTASDHLAVRSPLPSPALAQALVATGEGRAYGAQVLVRQELLHGLFGWVSYTYSRSQRRTDSSAAWRLFDYDQTHVFTAVAAYALPHGFEVGLRARVASGYPRTPVIGASFDATSDLYQPAFGAQNSERLPLFFQLDARVAERLKLRGTELEIYLDVQNVTNRANPEEIVYNHDYSQKGYITGLPVLPVLGVRWAF